MTKAKRQRQKSAVFAAIRGLKPRERLLLMLLAATACLSATVMGVVIPDAAEMAELNDALSAARAEQAQAARKVAGITASQQEAEADNRRFEAAAQRYAQPQLPEEIDRTITGLGVASGFLPRTLDIRPAMLVQAAAFSPGAPTFGAGLSSQSTSPGDASAASASAASAASASASASGTAATSAAAGSLSLAYSFQVTVTYEGGLDNLCVLIDKTAEIPWIIIEGIEHRDDDASGSVLQNMPSPPQGRYTVVFRVFCLSESAQ
ncbi:MAG: hypothetical protein LBD25_04475 [Coriobacteriales bacterium]|jgi:hypothetical protein|nr:hypothetical protein [Coriobacteriales bacterium]